MTKIEHPRAAHAHMQAHAARCRHRLATVPNLAPREAAFQYVRDLIRDAGQLRRSALYRVFLPG